MKFDVIVADPAWSFSDKITMSDVKRGAESQYAVLDIMAIKSLKVIDLAADDSMLALWVPSSLLQEGLDTMKAWGFRQTQTHVWVKTKKEPLADLIKTSYNAVVESPYVTTYIKTALVKAAEEFDLTDTLAFGMGRLFRQTHEICLIGVRGKIYDKLKNKSQRSVHFDPIMKHSAKPEALQTRLDEMFPKTSRLEMFARRERSGWSCVGLECPSTVGEDIRDSIDRLIKL